MNSKKLTAKEAKRHAILDAATELLVDKPTASLHDIATYAGIGIATLHRYFESREQLMLQLGLRATELVKAKMEALALDEITDETYIPKLVEALIPLGDKIYFLTHNNCLAYNSEMRAAEDQLKAPIEQKFKSLQKKGYLRSEVSSEWIFSVLYALLFHTWQQVQEGNIARKAAASLLVDTFMNGFKTNHAGK